MKTLFNNLGHMESLRKQKRKMGLFLLCFVTELGQFSKAKAMEVGALLWAFSAGAASRIHIKEQTLLWIIQKYENNLEL